MDYGQRIAYTGLEEGTPVVTRDGLRIGTVMRVLADFDDIFDALLLDTTGGDRFVDAGRGGVRVRPRDSTLGRTPRLEIRERADPYGIPANAAPRQPGAGARERHCATGRRVIRRRE